MGKLALLIFKVKGGINEIKSKLKAQKAKLKFKTHMTAAPKIDCIECHPEQSEGSRDSSLALRMT